MIKAAIFKADPKFSINKTVKKKARNALVQKIK
jgi:hypothetical protein